MQGAGGEAEQIIYILGSLKNCRNLGQFLDLVLFYNQKNLLLLFPKSKGKSEPQYKNGIRQCHFQEDKMLKSTYSPTLKTVPYNFTLFLQLPLLLCI